MLDNTIKEQLNSIFAGLRSDIKFEMQTQEDDRRSASMLEFLHDVASSSSKLSTDTKYGDCEAPTFEIIKDGKPTGVKFCGIPNGHEFTTLLLAVLNADGQGKNMPDEALAARIKALRGPLRLRVFVSLSCTNCPDVAQALNVIALLNPDIENTVIDGGVVPELVKKYGIKSVPAVFADDKLISVGRTTLGDLLTKLEEASGTSQSLDKSASVVREYDVTVLGGGPAGCAAAIYSARKGFTTAIVAGAVGGQVLETMEIGNLISVKSTTGPQLAASLKEHMAEYPIEVFENRTVKDVSVEGAEKVLSCGGETFKSRALIIATGAGWRHLSVPGESEHIGHGVAFCTHCDGPYFAGQRVAVVGGGNSGIEAAIDLASMCPHVDVFEFTDSLKADSVLQQKMSTLNNVDIHLSSQVQEIIGDGKSVSGIKVKNLVSGEVSVYPIAGVFVQIGLMPNSSLFKGQVPMNKGGEIEVDRYCRTAVKGVYAAGDVTNVPYKQIVIAMGEGGKAALSVFMDFMRGELG
ncbi:MAG: alkyl hydroperoxide reductase subunit F [Muribaculaceae bacterium]|nr:alkyl hydroperoxide reductase subunit F [Muribaculaceae bacterium]